MAPSRYGLKVLPSNAFLTTPWLTKLDLQNNGLEHVEEGALQPLKRMQVLDLSNNKLEVRQPIQFKELSKYYYCC